MRRSSAPALCAAWSELPVDVPSRTSCTVARRSGSAPSNSAVAGRGTAGPGRRRSRRRRKRSPHDSTRAGSRPSVPFAAIRQPASARRNAASSL